MFILCSMVVQTYFIFWWNKDFTTALPPFLLSPLKDFDDMATIMLETLFLNGC